MLYQHPEWAHDLMYKITQSTIAYLKAQVAAGVDVIQIFDSWAGILNASLYRTFALPYIQQICNAIKEVPVVVFAKGAYFALEELNKLNCEVLGLDWTMKPQIARQIIGATKVLQGNLDPCLLYADYNFIREETVKMLKAFGPDKHIVNLGHGVYPDTPFGRCKMFYRYGKRICGKYRID